MLGVTAKAVCHFRDYVLRGNIFRVSIVALDDEPRPTATDFDNAGRFNAMRPRASVQWH
jgi:hypothetical protein